MTYADIKNRIYFLTGTDVDNFSNADMTIAVKVATEIVHSLINEASNWQIDDSNYTDLSIAKTTLTSGQGDYSLAVAQSQVTRIEVKDSSGNWHVLDHIDERKIKRDLKKALAYGESTRTNAYKPTTGIPEEYDIRGISIFLLPIPNYTQTNSLFVYHLRNPLHFDYALGTFTDATGSTASSPGFNSLFHDLIALYASYDYCMINIPSRCAGIMKLILVKETQLKEFYGSRNQDDRPRLSIAAESNK